MEEMKAISSRTINEDNDTLDTFRDFPRTDHSAGFIN